MNQKSNISEATIKSVHEKMHRKTRRKKLTPRGISLPGKIVPKKTGNNDPTRGGNRVKGQKVDENIKAAVVFLSENITKKDDSLVESVNSFSDSTTLLKIVNHLIATRLGGWHEEKGRFVNESGHTASQNNWVLNEEGRLIPKGKSKPADYSIDWLYEVRSICQSKM